MKLTLQTIEKIDNCLNSPDAMPIFSLPYGLYDGGVNIGPCIFIGDIHQRVLLYPKNITLKLLEKIFNKALKDNDTKSTIALLKYAIYNKKMFWQKYKKTDLGIKVMADILGQHE